MFAALYVHTHASFQVLPLLLSVQSEKNLPKKVKIPLSCMRLWVLLLFFTLYPPTPPLNAINIYI